METINLSELTTTGVLAVAVMVLWRAYQKCLTERDALIERLTALHEKVVEKFLL